jgi:hypothetical protein
MKFLALLPALLTLLLTLLCFVTKAKRTAAEGEKLLSQPFFVALAGMLSAIFCVPTALLLWRGKWLGLAFLAFAALGWVLELAYCNCWVRYDAKGFTHSNLLGLVKRFSYEDVAPVCKPKFKQALAGNDLWIKAGSRRILIDAASRNRVDFLVTLSQRLQKNQWTNDVPRGWDPYNHNVPQPDGWFLFVITQLLTVFMVGLIGWFVYDYFTPAETAETTDHLVLSFSDYHEHKGDWDLTASDGETYHLDNDTKKVGVDPKAVCDGRTLYDVWLYRGRKSIAALRTTGGEDILTFAQVKALSNRETRIYGPVLLLFAAAMVWVDIGMIRTARHPERYSRRYRRLFWQDHYLLSDLELPSARFHRKRKK